MVLGLMCIDERCGKQSHSLSVHWCWTYMSYVYWKSSLFTLWHIVFFLNHLLVFFSLSTVIFLVDFLLWQKTFSYVSTLSEIAWPLYLVILTWLLLPLTWLEPLHLIMVLFTLLIIWLNTLNYGRHHTG